MPISVLTPATAVARANQVSRDFLTPLRAVLIGPRAGLHRFDVTAEQASLGAYDPLTDTDYDYPDKAEDSVVDLDSVKLIADNARLNYFNKYVGLNGTCQPDTTHANRVRASAYVFKTVNGGTRSADFGDRDVKVGDIAVVRGDDITLTTSVTGFLGEPVAATRGTATANSNNKATQTLSAAVEQVADTPINDVVATVDGSAYESTADGYVTRTYTVTVTQSSTGGDATTGLLRVRSADGGDDHDNVVPAAFGDPTSIGDFGLLLTLAIDSGNSSSSLFGIAEQDLVVGQAWTITVSQAFTATVGTSAGTYTGTSDDTYIITVSRGGLYAATVKPQITVTTANGSDRSGPTTVTAASTAFAVGSHGVTIAFNGTRLRKGDEFTVAVTAAAEGAVKTLILQDSVDDTLLGEEVDLRLFAERSGLEITAGTDTWAATADGLTVQAEITVEDPDFTDDGAAMEIPLDSADLFVEYREWLTTGVGELVTLSARADIEAALGPVDETNPLAQAADFALQNTSGELAGDARRPNADTTDVVYCLPLGGDPTDLDLWTDALNVIAENDEAYQVLPLTNDPDVYTLVRTHVMEQSEDTAGFYRTAWLSANLDEVGAVVSAASSSDDAVTTATITATPASSPTAYTTVTFSANAKLVTNAVRAGDVLRINFGTDDLGVETYDEFTVASVTSETILVLSAGPTAAIAVARRAEVYRAYTKDELVTQLIAAAAALQSDRVKYVWPDVAGFGGTTYAGYHLCAALAGLAGSVPSNQGLRNVGVTGFDSVIRASKFFTGKQQKRLADNGVFVVSALADGTVYVRGAGTTDPTDATTGEEMVIRNADMIHKAIQLTWAPYVGSGNVVSGLQEYMTSAIAGLTARFQAMGHLSSLGAPVGNLQVTSIAAVTGDPRTVDVVVTPSGLSVPLNQIQVRLPISVG